MNKENDDDYRSSKNRKRKKRDLIKAPLLNSIKEIFTTHGKHMNKKKLNKRNEEKRWSFS